MGRIKTQLVKRISHELIRDNPEMFKKDFVENKRLVNEAADIPSKKIRNLIAGAVTSLVKQEE